MLSSDIQYCAKHPKVETGITCASCGTPICPDCMVVTPVGMKCRQCGLQKGGKLFDIGFGRLAIAGLTAVVAGVVAAMVPHLGIFMIFISMAYGYFAGTVIMKSVGMKRGMKMEITAGVGMVLGAAAAKLIHLLIITGGGPITGQALLTEFFDPWTWVSVAIATACAVSKIRYV